MTQPFPLYSQPFPLYSINAPAFGSWKWLGKWSMIVLLSVCLILVGCSFASFVSAVQADLPVVLGIITNVTMFIAPGISIPLAAAGALALAALAVACGSPAHGAMKCDSTSLIGQYQSATDPALKTSLLQKVQAALATINMHIGSMLTIAKGLPPAAASAIITAVSLALATVTGILALIPVAAQPASAQKKAARDAQDRLKAQGMELKDAKTLRRAYNDAVKAQFPAAVLN